MSKTILTLVGLAIAVVLFFSVNLLANAKLRHMRVDLTEESLYTLSEGAKSIAAKLDEPIRLYFYFSEGVASEYPDIKAYGVRVAEVLEEFALASGGNILVERIDPEPFSEEEDRAVEEGVAGIQPPGSDVLYFGLVGTNATDDREVIPFLAPDKERFLEYDVSRMLYALANPAEKVVGVIAGIPMDGGPGNPMLGQPPAPPWQILAQLGQFFETRTLGTDVDAIDEDVDVLMIVHPKNLPDETLYAIDQYVLAGGKALVFVDPYCQADQPPQDPSNPMAAMSASRASDLGPLFQAWGVELVPNKILGDRENAYVVNVGTPLQPEEVGYVAWAVLDDEEIDDQDAVTSQLRKVFVATAGILRQREGATTTFSPLLSSSEDAAQIDVGSVQFGPDPKRLLNSFVPEYQRFTVAARIGGASATDGEAPRVASAFPDGPPGTPPADGEGEGEEGAEAENGTPADGHLAEATGPIHVIVVADVDFLHDRYWIQETRIGSLSLGFTKMHDNGDFALNAVENLSGGEDLISIRARGSFARPFTRIDELQREADERFRAEEQELEDKLEETRRRIDELQREKAPGESSIFLSPAQSAELEKFRAQELETRKKLRDVKHSLRKDIEALELRLKVANLFGMPAVVCLFALTLWIVRLAKRGQ